MVTRRTLENDRVGRRGGGGVQRLARHRRGAKLNQRRSVRLYGPEESPTINWFLSEHFFDRRWMGLRRRPNIKECLWAVRGTI